MSAEPGQLQAAQREMLAMVQERCPEAREWTRWPFLWAHVDPGASHKTIRFTIEHPKEAATATAAASDAETPAA
ncbi:MAG: hypothetical protein F4018_13855 [Acidobacteria bacterium]|nr:hypothetical protein [Acidobacteriota bacterium]MYK89322.1 hypothetical protein [Acidobacteriota bacterium]